MDFGNSRLRHAKGPAMKASLCEEAGGAHAESGCGAAIPGTVPLLKLAQNTEPNYHHRQVALVLHTERAQQRRQPRWDSREERHVLHSHFLGN